MAKRHHVQKLLAVMVMASAPAAAGPEHAHHAPPPVKPAAGAPAKADAKLTAAPAVQPDATPVAQPGARPATHAQAHAQAELARVLAIFGITMPRRLATGAPACGNVMSKGPRHCDEDAK